jgi:hypothetical protein
VKNPRIRTRLAAAAFAALTWSAGCTPKVMLEAPKEPIVINMNVKIDHEIRVKLDKDLDQAMAENPEVF